MILSGGVNIYPKDIEDVIYSLPGIDDVAVIGIPDEKWGEAVHAIIIYHNGTKLEPQDVISRCQQKLAAFQVPRSVEFRTQLPRNRSGKLLKRVLRDEFWKDKKI
jgi:acyl-CoA synthetase (AMP-forming)/AMP-acid ligase II